MNVFIFVFDQKKSICILIQFNVFDPHTCLPLTSSLVKFHSLRVFHQISKWKGENFNAIEYGWKEKDGKFIPLRTDLPPAHDHPLEVDHCNCKTSCSTLKCTFRWNGLECTFSCGDSKGTSCSNAMDPKAIQTEIDEWTITELQRSVPESWLLSSSGFVYLVREVPLYVTWLTLP